MPRPRGREVDLGVRHDVPVLSQQQRLNRDLCELRRPDGKRSLGRLAVLRLDGNGDTVPLFDAVEPGDDPQPFGGERQRGRDRFFPAERLHLPAFTVDASVGVGALRRVDVVGERARLPLQPGEPRAVDVLVDDPCRN